MLFAALVFSLFALLLGWAVWWTWRQRENARKQADLASKQAAMASQQAELASKQATMNAELVVLGERMRSVAHDVDNLFSILSSNLSSARSLPPEELREVLDDVERATTRAGRMMRAIRTAKVGPGGEKQVEPIVQLVAAIVGRGEVPIDLEVHGALAYVGSEEDALRVVQNLVGNAAREAKQFEGGRVSVVLGDGGLRVKNRTRRPEVLADASIWDAGVSKSGSSGLGLAIVRERAEAIGWSVDCTVDGDEVCFRVAQRRSAASDRRKN